ncbi:MAG TPA: PilC/PilY family type IV pilus protein [Candidatus Binatia bacterium]|nr:PilC/PilY family type IV pilus protein [Candidatus Binatia bacterium]
MLMKKTIAIIQVITILFWHGWNLRPLFADDSDIFGNNIPPNVMILLDSSGSMNDEAGTLIPYSSSANYTPIAYRGTTLATTTVYRRKTSGSAGGLSCRSSNPCYTVYATSISAVNSSSAQTALSTTGYWSGRIGGSSVTLYYGNYLNYYYCSSCDGIEPKITIAKRTLTNLVNNVEGVRFGLMRFSGTNGDVVEPIRDMTPTNQTTLINSINQITPAGWTPLGEQMRDAGNYYKGTYPGQSSPIQYSCQPSFIVVISDGLWNGVVDPRVEATNRFTQDHSTTYAGTQNVLVHTIGFSLNASNEDEKQAIADLQTMAKNGGGSYFTANNSAQLEVALQDAISQIMAATFSFATPVIPTTGTTGSARAYLASFQSNPSRPFWKGFLKAYTRDANGLIPVDAQGLPSGTPVWDAGQQLSLKSASSRTIKTYASSALENFTTSNSAITTSLLAAADTTEKDQIINYIRGATDYNDEDGDLNTTEERPWKLGDIFHSSPVLVTPPFLPIADTSYPAFKTAQASRATILLTGANDGMLHAFTEVDGEESWAFIPPNLLDDLKNLTAVSGTRDYYADSSPIVADVKTGGSWKTIAVFGERRGGNSYYGLNITNTTSPQYLWSFADANLGETWSEPAIGKVKMSDGTDKWVAFVGAGFDTTFANYSGSSKTSEGFFVIDLSNGAKLWEYYNATGSTDDRQYMNFSIPASPAAVDLNNDGYIDRVYIGDVGGQLWKFDMSAPATVSGGLVTNWTGKRLFTAAPSQANPPAAGEYYPAQAIFNAPALAYDRYNNLWVYFGTGDRYHPNNTSSNRFYGIKDNTTMANGSANTLTETAYTGYSTSALTNLTSGTGTVTQGWYIVLNSNEKVLAGVEVFNFAALFTTFTPTTAAVCGSGGGAAKLYAVNMTTGDAAFNLSTGATLPSGQAASAAAKSIGSGIPSKPIVSIKTTDNQATPYIITGTTNQEISTGQGTGFTNRKVVGWREVFY